MFSELDKYPRHDHFFFKPNQSLAKVCNAPSDQSGVYVIYKLAGGKITLIYIGSSGKKKKDGTLKTRKAGLGGLKDRLVNGKQFGGNRRITWPFKMALENIEGLDIYWWVTYDEHNQDFPKDIETLLLDIHHEIFGTLPAWNKSR